VISTNTLVKIRGTVVFSFLANRLATATLAQLTAGPRNKGHVATKIRAPEVPFTPTPPALHKGFECELAVSKTGKIAVKH